MPVLGDTLRYSNATPLTTVVSAADSGVNMSWVYSLTPTSQGLDEYKKPSQVNPLYALTLPGDCYGYKIADSIPGLSLLTSAISITDMYTFYNRYVSPDAYGAEAFGAKISGFPLGASYIAPDAVYFFPLDYNNNNSNDFNLKFGLATVGSFQQKGTRTSRVDGWGTILTPYLLMPTNCIRVRSEITEIDSVTFDTLSFGIPRVTVEYKYLVKGEHYPAVWATANVIGGAEIMTSVKYRDVYRAELNPNPAPTAVQGVGAQKTDVSVYPNPAVNGKATLSVPESWKVFYAELFDTRSRSVATFSNTTALNMEQLPAGNYLLRVLSGGNISFVKVVIP